MADTDQVIVPLTASNWPRFKAGLKVAKQQAPPSRAPRGLMVLSSMSKSDKDPAIAGVLIYDAGAALILLSPFRHVFVNEALNAVTLKNLLVMSAGIRSLAFVEGNKAIFGIPWNDNGMQALTDMGMDKQIVGRSF